MSHESHKAEHADRSVGGPGSSQQNKDKPETHQAGEEPNQRRPVPGEATSDSRSHRGGGGGEQDRHHSHDPAQNSTSRKA